MEFRPLVSHGMAIGLSSLVNFEFDLTRPYTYCRICGSVYQSLLCRVSVDPVSAELATLARKEWSHNHAASHNATEHEHLAMSGLWLHPDAANKLASFGVIPVSDMILSDETAQALLESSAIPTNDAEGSRY